MGEREVWIEFQSFLILSYSFLVPMAEIVNPAVVGINNQREGIEFARSLNVCQRICISTTQCKGEPQGVVPGCVARIKRDGALVLGLTLFPSPLKGINLCHRRV